MARTNTFLDASGERRWQPSAVCPCYGVSCQVANSLRLCQGDSYDENPDSALTCRVFRCASCGRYVPWSYGASDDMPDVCDACWARLRVKKKEQRA